MNAKPALVRPRFASDLDPQAALWIARLSTSFSAAVGQFNDSVYSEELRQITGISPQQDSLNKAALKALLKIRAVELEMQHAAQHVGGDGLAVELPRVQPPAVRDLVGGPTGRAHGDHLAAGPGDCRRGGGCCARTSGSTPDCFRVGGLGGCVLHVQLHRRSKNAGTGWSSI